MFALKGQKYKNTGDEEKTLLPLQGADTIHQGSQGDALGYGLLPLQGVQPLLNHNLFELTKVE